MNIRSKAILEAAIKEYINSGNPVSSKELAEKYDFGLKCASVRRELGNLTKEGYLAQLHTSGGRVPTDKGYQLFVSDTLSNVVASKKIINNRYSRLTDNLLSGQLRDFIEEFSGEVKSLGVGQREAEKEVYKSGLDELFGQLDLDTKEELYEVVKDFELLDKRLEEIRNRVFKNLPSPQVFIGKKSPITKSENLSVILDSYDIDGQKILIAVIGSKRMDYKKNLKLFKLFHQYE